MKYEIPGFALGMHQANVYWSWLVSKYPADTAQCIAVALLSVPGLKPSREFSNELNRQLYRLAREMGWARPKYEPGADRPWFRREEGDGR